MLRRRGGGERLFAYWDWEDRAWHEVHAEELNDYLRARAGAGTTAKDFRTWHATVLAGVLSCCHGLNAGPWTIRYWGWPHRDWGDSRSEWGYCCA
ncbi:hypothetical protein ACFC5Z_25200 [Streptomyces sp. NPDC056004]|uniref:hypothetical protein n=1 Tax=unclassified Streptomyces TaxID=2593676 RepID=UPI0035E22E65